MTHGFIIPLFAVIYNQIRTDLGLRDKQIIAYYDLKEE